MTSPSSGERLDHGAHVEALSWPELARRAPGAVGLLPVGAASKEHGRHLPLGTDAIQARWIAAAVAARREALVWPLVGYGHYPAFTNYPGSPSLDADAFGQLLERALASMCRSGHRVCVVLNTGISTIETVDEVCRGISEAHACHVYRGERFRRAVERVCEQSAGGHADEVETSLMMHIAPSMVDPGRARDESATEFGPGPLVRDDPFAPNFSPSGAMGNARLADPGKGRVLAGSMLADVLALLDRHRDTIAR